MPESNSRTKAETANLEICNYFWQAYIFLSSTNCCSTIISTQATVRTATPYPTSGQTSPLHCFLTTKLILQLFANCIFQIRNLPSARRHLYEVKSPLKCSKKRVIQHSDDCYCTQTWTLFVTAVTEPAGNKNYASTDRPLQFRVSTFFILQTQKNVSRMTPVTKHRATTVRCATEVAIGNRAGRSCHKALSCFCELRWILQIF